jgi:hypothetical protein
VGGWIQEVIGAKKDHILKYAIDSNRRLVGSFYSYNYGVYVENGAKVMKGLSEYRASPIHYADIPGTMYRMNLKTFMIPGYEAANWQKAVGKSLMEGLKYLRTHFDSKHVTEMEKVRALLIAAANTYHIIIMNEDVVKYKCERYVHIFSKQVKFMITINPNNWVASFTQSAALSYALEAPTLQEGEIYVCAKFGNEWQGMKIIKVKK